MDEGEDKEAIHEESSQEESEEEIELAKEEETSTIPKVPPPLPPKTQSPISFSNAVKKDNQTSPPLTRG